MKVKKRDGGQEAWSDDKLISSMTKAGVPVGAASGIAAKIKDWAKKEAKDDVIASTDVRDEVIKNLKADYPAEANSYEAYKKS